mgnify:CR=1 FL=1
MFEDKNRNVIHEEMLNDISDEYDKTPGSPIYISTRPAAIQSEKIYQSLDKVVGKLDVENLKDNELARFVNQRSGITRRQATFAVGTLNVTGTGTITQGDLFETESGVQFTATETKEIISSGTVHIQAVLPGAIGNVLANQITVIPVTITGIASVTNINPTTEGYNAETDNELRQRYYERTRTPSTSGNRHHYKNWAKEVPGVGDARIIPLWNGDNTVKVIIIDSEKKPASTELVDAVQDYIDPGITGTGDGAAPIGAYCTVVSAAGLDINISFTAVKDPAYSDEDIQNNVEQAIVDYLKEIAFMEDYVSYARIGSLILNSPGINDYTDLTVNGGMNNIQVTNEQVAVLGGVTIV